MEPFFRLFVDEVGHGSMKFSDHPNERYLSLTGVIMRIAYERGEFAENLDALKTEIFGRTNIVLHRAEIVRKAPPFECLRNANLCHTFDTHVLRLLETSSYRVITIVIDKKEHKHRYRVWQAYPYHYCMMALLERYVMWLQGARSHGDVMAESRGQKDNRKLEDSYWRLHQQGTAYVGPKMFQARLSTKELKIKPKEANIAGLQLADLIANPSMWSVICDREGSKMEAAFGARVADILKRSKYRRRYDGVIAGIGTKWLP